MQPAVPMQELSQVDVVFCIDLTNSMSPFLERAKQHLIHILNAFAGITQADLAVAVVGYTDYSRAPTYDPVVAHNFSNALPTVMTAIGSLDTSAIDGNTDAAEAVFAGLQACAQRLTWRPRSFKAAVLVGDGPPHGQNAIGSIWPDRWPTRDPTNLSLQDFIGLYEGAGTAIYSLAMVPSSIPEYDSILTSSFERLAKGTGGVYAPATGADAAIGVVQAMCERIFGDMHFDRSLFMEASASGGSAEEYILQKIAQVSISSTPAPRPTTGTPGRGANIFAVPAPVAAVGAKPAPGLSQEAERLKQAYERLHRRGYLQGQQLS